jgi:threonyl-tRNA synthetase
MAQALTELYPGIKLAIGPPIENGFYYDVDPPSPIREEDLAKIEAKMKELSKLDQRIIRTVAKDREEARERILSETIEGQPPETAEYKLLLLEAVPTGEEVSFYEQQRTDREGKLHKFVDLCRGPHVDTTKEVKFFKLMSIAGAYWRGDSKNKQLTRIYGTAFESKEDLDLYLVNLEEAKKRDHRILGKELGLFMFSPRVGTGLPLWLPKGAILRDTLVNFMKNEQLRRGYDPVVTPSIGNIRLFEKSGHVITYKDKMFPFMEDEEKETYILKPMNCPFHIEIYASQMRSYRDLPVRLAEFGTVHRYEQSGEVAGILRARGFTQDDAHLFVRPDQLLDEFIGVVDLMKAVLDKLGLKKYRARLGTRDEGSKYVGHLDNWKAATEAIEQACQKIGLEYEISPGDAAFYGPKLDLMIKDALGRDWQMGTVQVDYNLPERFDLEYIGEDSKPHRPIMIHRAPFGSLERMIGLLTEEYAGAYPFWLAPVQVEILPIADRHCEAAVEMAKTLRDVHGYRVTVDERRETLGRKIRDSQLQKVPFMLILGDRDLENGTVGVRNRELGDLGAMSLDDLVAKMGPVGG